MLRKLILLIFMTPVIMLSQEITITGVVSSSDGVLPGVNVSVKVIVNK